MARFTDLTIGEDEPWSPTSVVFSLLAAQSAGLQEGSILCDLGAGEAASSVAIARRTGSEVYAVDCSEIAIASMKARAEECKLGERFHAIHEDAISYLADAHGQGAVFDMVLAEGGIAGVVGHQRLLEQIRPVLHPDGILVLSGYVYNGIIRPESGTDPVFEAVPVEIRSHYENTRHANGRREILDEQELITLSGKCGYTPLFNCRAGQNHWTSYFGRMYEMCRSKQGAARVYDSTERQFGLDEGFHNLRGQRYLSYSMMMLTRSELSAEADRQDHP